MQHEIRHLSEANFNKIKNAVKDILEALGEDCSHGEIANTPNRVALMYDEVFAGMRYSNREIAELFGRCFEIPQTTDMVCITDIDAFSYCEHHLALMYNMKVNVAYIPKKILFQRHYIRLSTQLHNISLHVVHFMLNLLQAFFLF